MPVRMAWEHAPDAARRLARQPTRTAHGTTELRMLLHASAAQAAKACETPRARHRHAHTRHAAAAPRPPRQPPGQCADWQACPDPRPKLVSSALGAGSPARGRQGWKRRTAYGGSMCLIRWECSWPGAHATPGATALQLRSAHTSRTHARGCAACNACRFGFNVGMGMVDGLWAGGTEAATDFALIAYQIRLLGYNAVRLPFTWRDLDMAPRPLDKACSPATADDLRRRMTSPARAGTAAPAAKPLPGNVSPKRSPRAGYCNAYLPTRSGYHRLLFVTQMLVAQGMYVILDYQPMVCSTGVRGREGKGGGGGREWGAGAGAADGKCSCMADSMARVCAPTASLLCSSSNCCVLNPPAETGG